MREATPNLKLSSNCEGMQIYIGTSGWHYKHWRGPFYPGDLSPAKMLTWYADRFDTVEINNTFYKVPTSEALAGWCRQTPPNFCFAVKASRYITHNRKLKDSGQTVEKFVSQIRQLGNRLGPILFQLPPSWKVNLNRLEEFLAGLPPKHRYVFEFRNETWNSREVFELLRRYKAAVCLFELAGYESPIDLTADFAYIRLHGPGNKYQGDYTAAQLAAWADRIQSWSKTLKHVFIYFDNDQAGFAAKNALELKRLMFSTETRKTG